MFLSYGDVIQTLSLAVEIAILVYVVKEFSHVTKEVKGVTQEVKDVTKEVHDIKDARNRTVFGLADDLNVGDRVHVLEPRPGVPRKDWQYNPELYVIRSVDNIRNRALATPVLPPVQGPTPTVDGPLRGEHSPFKKASVPG